jgi:hypothetical protein
VNLLRILAAESNKNVVIGDDVKGKMSISLRNVPWDLALDTILETRGLRKIEKDNVLRIVSIEQLTKEREAAARVEEARLKAESDVRAKAAEAQLKEQEAIDKKRAAESALAELQARGPLKEETIRLSYADPEDLARTLQGILGIPAEGIQAHRCPSRRNAAHPRTAVLGALRHRGTPAGGAGPVVAVGRSAREGHHHSRAQADQLALHPALRERPGKLKKLIRERFDIPLPQVKIEARMEILDRDDLFAIGVQWGGGAVSCSRTPTRSWSGAASPARPPTRPPEPRPRPTSSVRRTSRWEIRSRVLLPISALTGLPLGGNVVNLPVTSALGGSPAVASGGAARIAFGITGSRYNVNLALEALRV